MSIRRIISAGVGVILLLVLFALIGVGVLYGLTYLLLTT